MNNKKELLKNTIIIFIGRICTQFTSFLLLPIYTAYLITSDYGTIDLIQTYIALFIPIITLRLDASIFRFLIDERDNKKNTKEIITNAIFTVSIVFFVFLMIYFIIGTHISIKYYWLILFNIIFMALSNAFLQITRGIGDNIGYSISCCIMGMTIIVLNIIFVVIYRMGGTGVLLASGIGNLTGCIYIAFRENLLKYIDLKEISKTKIKELLKYSLPMIPDGLSWWIINASDRTIISFFINASANGIYAVSSKFSNILASIFSVVNMSWQESASLHIDDEDRDKFFSDIINETLKIFVFFCIAIIACIPIAFELLIGKDYFEALKYIPILLLANIFNVLAGMFGAIYISKKLTNKAAKTTVLGATINIVINILLIKKLGLFAAAFSTLIAYFALFLCRYYDSKKYVNIKFNKKIIIGSVFIFFFSTVLYTINCKIGNIINILLIAILALIFNKQIIKSIKKER